MVLEVIVCVSNVKLSDEFCICNLTLEGLSLENVRVILIERILSCRKSVLFRKRFHGNDGGFASFESNILI